MSSRTIRFVILLATISILGIVITQIYWVRQAVIIERSEFTRNVNLALVDAAENYYRVTETPPPTANPILMISENKYVVMIDGAIDANLLEVILKTSFPMHNLYTDFQYTIFRSSNSEEVFKSIVKAIPSERLEPKTDLPVFNDTKYYFGVYFPSRTFLIFDRMQVWIYSSIILLAVVFFFAYSMFVILKQKRLSEVQKDFINNMTHEFKTPIATIEIASDVLKDPSIKDRPERLLKYATIIENENKRLKNQVDKVLQIASIDRATIELQKQPTDIHALIDQAVANIETSSPEATITAELKASSHTIQADPVHVTNIIYNLLDNGIKYSKNKPVIVINTSNDSGMFIMDIKDNGIGISNEHQKDIFNKFYRVPTGDQHDAKGFGIGLHYVRLIVEAHGGRIDIQSEIDNGSIFTIRLPL